MPKRLQVYVDDDLLEIIEKYSLSVSKGISETLKDLIKVGLKSSKFEKELSLLTKSMKKSYNKLNFLVMLIEQIYSDLEIENPTDYRNNKILRKLERDFSMGINDE